MKTYKYIDLFCGIGGFRYAIEAAAKKSGYKAKCVFSSDIDRYCQDAYEANFLERPAGDISTVDAKNIPNHDILLAGFPCQPFSIIGQMKGFSDTRGTLFFEIARIIEEKRPRAFVLENVKLLVGHNKGRTIKTIIEALELLDYSVDYRVLNALNFGLPQKRERIFIIGLKNGLPFSWSENNIKRKSLNDILEKRVEKKYFVSEKIRKKRLAKMNKTPETTVWHENKAGNISAYPYSCALRAGASYNYLLVNGERRLTEREMLRLQGFPETFRIVHGYAQTRKQIGNSLPIPIAEAVISDVFSALSKGSVDCVGERRLILKGVKYEAPKIKNGRKIPAPVSA
jgi:DNA (cytosine-5)-methyltransferase 1